LSRLPSSRGSSASSAAPRSGVSAAPRQRGIVIQSPKSDIFVVMLGIALGAIILGCLLMTIVLSRYSFSTKVSAVAAPTQAGALA
jgi:hypothetical protein